MSPDLRTPAQRRWDALPPDPPRDEYFKALRDVLAESYLADPADVYRQNGRSSGAKRWEETRRCIADAVGRDGAFLDVGCANGLLLESLARWCSERGIRIIPHGIDFIPELVALARARNPDHPGNFQVANAFYWQPERHYDYVRTNLEYVPRTDGPELIARSLARAVAPGGRLIVCHYAADRDPLTDVPRLLRDLGYTLAGAGRAPGVSLAWTDKPVSRS